MTAPLSNGQAVMLVARREFTTQVRSRGFIIGIVFVVDVFEIDIANLCEGVPVEHRVDRLRHLCATRLVNAARVDPDPGITIALSDLAGPTDLLANVVARVFSGDLAFLDELWDVLECLLLVGALSPLGVGEDGIASDAGGAVGEVAMLCTSGAEDPGPTSSRLRRRAGVVDGLGDGGVVSTEGALGWNASSCSRITLWASK